MTQFVILDLLNGKRIGLMGCSEIQMEKLFENMENQKEITRAGNPNFYKMWDLKNVQRWREEQKHLKHWYSFEIYATTTRDLVMNVWNGTHPVEENTTQHICKAGTKVRVWMVSRFGDVGVTDNLLNPKGYDIRGLDADVDLKDYEFVDVSTKKSEL